MMQSHRTRALALAASTLLLLLTAAPAQAITLGLQDDDAAVLAGDAGTAAFLQRADDVSAPWVRIMVPDSRWNGGQAVEYVRAAERAHAAGKRVMVSLLAYNSHPTPDQWRSFAEQVTPRLAPYADAWSPMNEPNWPTLSPAVQESCVVAVADSSTPVSSGGRVIVQRRWKHVRRGTHWRHHHRKGGRWIYHRVKRHGKQHRRGHWRKVNVRRIVPPTVSVVANHQEWTECKAESVGRAYRRVWDATAPVIRASDPGATLVVGDLCPCADDLAFMEAFYEGGTPAVAPDVLGIHPYPGVDYAQTMADYARRRSLTPWVTEWGLPRDTNPRPAQWTGSLQGFRRAGYRVAFIYDTRSANGWDTQMRADDREAVAALAD